MRHCGTQALLNCWCVRTGIASAYLSVAMVKSHGRLYIVNRRGTVRGYRFYFRSTYNSLHATLAKGRKARHEAERAMALKAAQDKATPPLHAQGLLLRFSKEQGEWIYRGRARQRGSDTKVYIGSSSSMK